MLTRVISVIFGAAIGFAAAAVPAAAADDIEAKAQVCSVCHGQNGMPLDPKTMQFRFNEDQPLDAQAIVVDETSMLDLFLAHSLLKAIPLVLTALYVGQVHKVGEFLSTRELAALSRSPEQVLWLSGYYDSGRLDKGNVMAVLQPDVAILDSARESLPAKLRGRVDEAAAQVLGIERDPGASFTYTCFRVRASR